MVPDHDFLQAVSSKVFFPPVGGQELLQVSRRNPGRHRDRLTTLLAEVGQLPFDVGREMRPRLPLSKTIVELSQIRMALPLWW
jgi:hypothetical protein